MRQYLLLSIIALLASNCQATITCSKPSFKTSAIAAPIYHFKSVVTCELIDENIDFKALKDAYLQDIVKKNSQFKVHKKANYTNSKGLSGYSLDVTQNYNSPNGAVTVRAKIIIADDQGKNFYYELRSNSIASDGDAKFEKSLLNTTTLQGLPNKAQLIVIKETDVEKPWYAPDSIFFERVESELQTSIKNAALANARKICGQAVDPLRK